MRKLLLAVLGLGAALAQEINPQGIIVNPVPTDLEVQVWVDKDPAKRGNAVYRIGESIYIYVRVNQDAYVYLFNINADGRIDPILPNPYERDNFLRAGETRRFPPEGARYRYTITGPEGEDRILAVASRRPLSVAEILDVERGEVRVQGWEGLARALSIVVKPVPARDWVTDVARYYVGRGEAPPPAEATLEVDSSPRGAEVYVDGRLVGRAPLSLSLEAGLHEVRLLAPGYAEYRARVEVRPEETLRLSVELVPLRATLEVYVNVEARVFLDGEEVGRTRGGYLRLEAPFGEHELTLVAPGYRTLVQTLQVSGDRVLRFQMVPLRR